MLTSVTSSRPRLFNDVIPTSPYLRSEGHLSHGRLVLPVGMGFVPDGGFSRVGEPSEIDGDALARDLPRPTPGEGREHSANQDALGAHRKGLWRNHASVNSITRPRSTHGVTLQGGHGGQFCRPHATGSEPA